MSNSTEQKFLELHQDEYISNFIRNNTFWKPFTTNLLLEIFRMKSPKTVFIDVGANIGYFTLIAANSNVPTIAFEPINENFKLLGKTIERNNYSKLVNYYKIGVSDESDKILKFGVYTKNMGKCNYSDIKQDDCDYFENVKTKTLDYYFGNDSLNDLIIKIDVNGYEKNVLKGMKKVFENNKVKFIFLEFQKYDEEIFQILKDNDFLYVINLNINSDVNYIDNNSIFLQNTQYYTTLQIIEQQIKNNPSKSQRSLLLYKVENPLNVFGT